MRYLLVSAAAVMAVTGAAAIGNAQMQDRAKEPSAAERGPSSGGTERSPGPSGKMQQQQQQPGSSRTDEKSEPRKGAEREPDRNQPRAAQQEKDQRKNTQAPETGKDRSKSANQPQREKNQANEQQRDKKDQQKSTQQQRRDQDNLKSTEQKQSGKDQQKSAKGEDQKQAGRVQVSEEKRSGVRERLVKEKNVEKINRSRINVSINVGTRIPRSVRLHTLPVSIVSFAPAYRGYSYIVLEDESICIVDPRTYVIVDVIPAGSQRASGPGRTHLALSAEDMRFIYRTVPKRERANVHVRLALGAEVPRDVELLTFPEDVVARVPDVRRYRYIVTDNDVVIVDPDDHGVALVINE